MNQSLFSAISGRFDLDQVEEDVRMFAFSHGICALDPQQNLSFNLPVTWLPSPMPRSAFLNAVQLQTSVNLLVHKIARDPEFLQQSLKPLPDPFVQKLFRIYETVQRNGYAPRYQLGIFRADYMVSDDQLKQVEINTISSGFSAIAPAVYRLHRYVLENYLEMSPNDIDQSLPPNPSLDRVAQALVDAHLAYQRPDAAILVLICEQESNLFDQKLIEFEMKRKLPHIKVHRRTFRQLDNQVRIGPNKELLLCFQDQTLTATEVEISVVYFRTAYTSANFDYENAWQLRLLVEESKAIKCPSIQLQLAGFKKFQTLLSDRTTFDRYCDNEDLYKTFVKFWNINEASGKMACEDPSRYVLKSNQEGGGHNHFGPDIVPKIDEILSGDQRESYFLMEFIRRPTLRTFVIGSSRAATRRPMRDICEIDHELGVYGTIMADQNCQVNFNCDAGYLLRSKMVESHEAGVIAAGGILDTPFLLNK